MFHSDLGQVSLANGDTSVDRSQRIMDATLNGSVHGNDSFCDPVVSI